MRHADVVFLVRIQLETPKLIPPTAIVVFAAGSWSQEEAKTGKG
jgi:hypothetical protein